GVGGWQLGAVAGGGVGAQDGGLAKGAVCVHLLDVGVAVDPAGRRRELPDTLVGGVISPFGELEPGGAALVEPGLAAQVVVAVGERDVARVGAGGQLIELVVG